MEAALRHVGFLGEDDQLTGYWDRDVWSRGGSETYTCRFEIEWESKDTTKRRDIFCKAIISHSDTAARWRQMMRRRQALVDAGGNAPESFGYWHGLAFEQYIPFDFRQAYLSAGPTARQHLATELTKLGEALDRARFAAINVVPNVRTDLRTVYLVDLGEDLGEPATASSPRSVAEVSAWLEAVSSDPTRLAER